MHRIEIGIAGLIVSPFSVVLLLLSIVVAVVIVLFVLVLRLVLILFLVWLFVFLFPSGAVSFVCPRLKDQCVERTLCC